MALMNGTTALASTAYVWDSASRLVLVKSGDLSAGYIYVANSPLVAEITFTNNGVEIMRTVKSYDMLNRLTNIVSTTNGVALSKFAYLYNTANQRTRATMVDGSYWLWGYDSLGQVTSAKRYWSDNSPVAGQQFEFAFDTIGNRVTTRTGGDLYAANLRQADYGANFLNQYTNRSIPGFVDVQGSAHSNATVSVWGDNGSWSPTVRKGEYFRGELAVTNSAAAVWLGFTNIAVLNTATNDIITNILGHTFVPQTPEAFTHDLDGNVTGDGKWTYTWDAENRLIAMENVASVPNAAKWKLEFGYDSRWRRTSKVVSTNLNGTYYPAYTNYFVYDGWNLIAILGPQSTVLRSFIWGLDLSGSLQGAGGVGGLLCLSEISNGQISSSHAAAFDGNGNLTSLLNATTRTESARYEFGPFGEVLRATGPMATANPFRFSTKFQDEETGLLYYGYRYYDPSTGRWNSRDPVDEWGGMNLFGFVSNNALSNCDKLGRELGVGLSAGMGLHFVALGADVSVSAVVTTKCRLCVTISETLRLGPGMALHAGAGGILSWAPNKSLEGCNFTAGLGVVWAEGVGLSGSVEGNINGVTVAGGKGEVGAGGAAGIQLSLNCTGCASWLYGPSAPLRAGYRALKFMSEAKASETFKQSFGL
jgi:RHS repeat-associated protein